MKQSLGFSEENSPTKFRNKNNESINTNPNVNTSKPKNQPNICSFESNAKKNSTEKSKEKNNYEVSFGEINEMHSKFKKSNTNAISENKNNKLENSSDE